MPNAADSSKTASQQPIRGSRHFDPADPGDRLFGRMWNLEHYVVEHWPLLAAVAGGIVLLGCVIIGVREYQQSRRAAAATAMFEAAQIESEEERLEALSAAARDYQGLGPGAEAGMAAASLAFERGEYDRAQTLYGETATSAPSPAIAAASMLGQATALEAAGRPEQARAVYEDVLARYPNSFVRPQAELALGRLAEAQGDTTTALAHYRAVVGTSAGTIWEQEAAERLDRLSPQATADTTGMSPTLPSASE